jgi:RNA polymerase subunit RPABC4/transcription elongation factor Spt4
MAAPARGLRCVACGAEVPGGAGFCPECGTRVPTAAAPITASGVVMPPVQPTATATIVPAAAPQQETTAETPGGSWTEPAHAFEDEPPLETMTSEPTLAIPSIVTSPDYPDPLPVLIDPFPTALDSSEPDVAAVMPGATRSDAMVCQACGAEMPAESVFCPECGTRVASIP